MKKISKLILALTLSTSISAPSLSATYIPIPIKNLRPHGSTKRTRSRLEPKIIKENAYIPFSPKNFCPKLQTQLQPKPKTETEIKKLVDN